MSAHPILAAVLHDLDAAQADLDAKQATAAARALAQEEAARRAQSEYDRACQAHLRGELEAPPARPVPEPVPSWAGHFLAEQNRLQAKRHRRLAERAPALCQQVECRAAELAALTVEVVTGHRMADLRPVVDEARQLQAVLDEIRAAVLDVARSTARPAPSEWQDRRPAAHPVTLGGLVETAVSGRAVLDVASAAAGVSPGGRVTAAR